MTKAKKDLSTFIPLLIVILLWSLFIGGFRFLLKNVAAGPLNQDPALLLEQVVGYLSIGGFLAFTFGGPIASISSKRAIIFRDAAIALVLIVAHYLWGLESENFFIVVAIVVGIFYSMFSLVRSILTSVEMKKSGLPDTMINGIATIAFIIGIIGGGLVSTYLYEQVADYTLWVFLGLLAGICLVSLKLDYKHYEEHVPTKKAVVKFVTDAKEILRSFYFFLIPMATLWAVSTVVSVKSVPYAQETYGLSESLASVVLLCSAVGVILGNLITLKVQNRWLWFRIYIYSFAALVAAFFLLTKSFVFMILYSIAIGMSMGAASNLLDAYYLKLVGERNLKESGVAVSGILLNATIAGLVFILQSFAEHTQVLAMGVLMLLTGIFVRLHLKKIRKI